MKNSITALIEGIEASLQLIVLGIVLYLLSLLFTACSKPITHQQCGTVIAKTAVPDHQQTIDVDYSGVVVRERVGLVQYEQINVGDTYCQ